MSNVFASTHSLWDDIYDGLGREYGNAVVYGDAETVLHEGAVRLLPNGWVELPTGRLLSPKTVHHIDPRKTDE